MFNFRKCDYNSESSTSQVIFQFMRNSNAPVIEKRAKYLHDKAVKEEEFKKKREKEENEKEENDDESNNFKNEALIDDEINNGSDDNIEKSNENIKNSYDELFDPNNMEDEIFDEESEDDELIHNEDVIKNYYR